MNPPIAGAIVATGVDAGDATVGPWQPMAFGGHVPEISRFYGIVIKMFYHEHGRPHFHAVYGEYHATFDIDTGEARGAFPFRLQSLVLEWVEVHRVELMDDWDEARAGRPLRRIAPLE